MWNKGFVDKIRTEFQTRESISLDQSYTYIVLYKSLMSAFRRNFLQTIPQGFFSLPN